MQRLENEEPKFGLFFTATCGAAGNRATCALLQMRECREEVGGGARVGGQAAWGEREEKIVVVCCCSMPICLLLISP